MAQTKTAPRSRNQKKIPRTLAGTTATVDGAPRPGPRALRGRAPSHAGRQVRQSPRRLRQDARHRPRRPGRPHPHVHQCLPPAGAQGQDHRSAATKSSTTTPSPCSTTVTMKMLASSSSRSSSTMQLRLRLLRPRRARQHDRRLPHLPRAPHRGHPHNPRNRIQARSDSDFQDMADDPRFTELLYPEA